jgi:aldehyde:ferredoxin oxidoreductase
MNYMPYGYNGKILRVNLTDEKIIINEPEEKWYRTYLGGMGSVAYHLLKEVKKQADPLGPDNVFIFSMGPITGAPVSGSGRNAVGAKSPLTGGFGEADAGGFVQVELKNAGFDEIIFEGEAEKPVWLWVNNGKAELRDALNLWGLQVAEAQDQMRNEVGEKNARTTLIGEAGEKKSRIACVINDLNHVAGRCGIGAIMGAKKLKGIAVKGHNPPKLADPEKVRELGKTLISRIETESSNMHRYGTGAAMDTGAATGNLPTRNFRDGGFENPMKIDARTVKDTYRVGMGTCHACAVRCKKEVELKEPYQVEAYYGGPEYETLAALGSDCGVSDLAAICKANELCQRYGLDTISTGATIAFAMECYEHGIITKNKTNGIDLRFGNAEAMVKVTELMGKREGIGNILSDGVKRASEVFGKESERFAIHIKGQEVPMHEPRFKKALGLGYAVSPTGADHCHNIHDTYMNPINYEKVRPLGILEEVPISSLGPDKVRLYRTWTNMRVLANCLSICSFPPWRFTEYMELLNAVTGWNTSMHELVMVAERTLNLARIFNLREGFRSSDDWLPERFFEPQTSGLLSKTSVNKEELSKAIATYYGMMGWDSQGSPKQETLQFLNIDWAYNHLP